MITRRIFLALLGANVSAFNAKALDFDALILNAYLSPAQPIFAALLKIFPFKDYGLKLQFIDNPLNADMAFIDFDDYIRLQRQNLRLILNMVDRPAFDIVGRKSKGITSDIKSIEDKILNHIEGEKAIPYLKNLVVRDKLKLESVGAHILEPLLASGESDALVGASYHLITGLKARGVPLEDLITLSFEDFGFAQYGLSLAVKDTIIAENADKIRSFTQNFIQFLKETQANPQALIQEILKTDANLQEKLVAEELALYFEENIFTPKVLKTGFGVFERDRFAQALQEINAITKLEKTLSFDEVVNSSFLPTL